MPPLLLLHKKNRKQSLFVQCAIIVLHLTKSFEAWRRVSAAVFRQRSVASDSARAVSAPPCSANRCYCIALHIPRTTGTANNISMPRSGRRLGRATFYYLKQIAAHSTRLNVGCYAQWRICFCVAH